MVDRRVRGEVKQNKEALIAQQGDSEKAQEADSEKAAAAPKPKKELKEKEKKGKTKHQVLRQKIEGPLEKRRETNIYIPSLGVKLPFILIYIYVDKKSSCGGTICYY